MHRKVFIDSNGNATTRRPSQLGGVTLPVTPRIPVEAYMIDVTPRGSGPSGAPALPRRLL